jgi:hypothetical protein
MFDIHIIYLKIFTLRSQLSNMCFGRRIQIRLKKEQEEKEQKRKEKAEAHLYTIIKVNSF